MKKIEPKKSIHILATFIPVDYSKNGCSAIFTWSGNTGIKTAAYPIMNGLLK